MKTKYIVPLLLFCLFACIACEDETTEMPRLFRPSFIASSCFAESNTITLAWRTSGEATSYTVELSQDATFSRKILKHRQWRRANVRLRIYVMRLNFMPVSELIMNLLL